MELYTVFVIFPMVISEVIPFNVPFKKSSRVGGVETPPYGMVKQITAFLFHYERR